MMEDFVAMGLNPYRLSAFNNEKHHQAGKKSH
jgi:hypothetical protein